MEKQTYAQVWQAMYDLAVCCNENAKAIELEALAHENLLNYCFNNDYRRKSFRACVLQIQIEQGINFKGMKSYTKVFRNYTWCKRIIQGRPI